MCVRRITRLSHRGRVGACAQSRIVVSRYSPHRKTIGQRIHLPKRDNTARSCIVRHADSCSFDACTHGGRSVSAAAAGRASAQGCVVVQDNCFALICGSRDTGDIRIGAVRAGPAQPSHAILPLRARHESDAIVVNSVAVRNVDARQTVCVVLELANQAAWRASNRADASRSGCHGLKTLAAAQASSSIGVLAGRARAAELPVGTGVLP